MKVKHTPGNCVALFPSDDFPRFAIVSRSDAGEVGIGEVYACLEDSDGEQAMCAADASLVAAAPQLLALAERWLRLLDDSGSRCVCAAPEHEECFRCAVEAALLAVRSP